LECPQLTMNHKKGIYIAWLNQGEIRVENAHIIARWVRENKYHTHLGLDFHASFPSAKPIINNRNQIALDFLKKKEYEYLLMIDDTIIPPMNLLDLSLYDKDVMTPILFAYRQDAIVPLVLKKREGKKDYEVATFNGDEGLVEVDAVGTGCIMIHRRVLEHPKMRFPFKNKWNKDGVRILGQDLNFCKRVKEAGFKIWVHLDYICDHWTPVGLKSVYEAMLKRDIKAGALDTKLEFKYLTKLPPAKIHQFNKGQIIKNAI